jgi:predicted GNAT superfamily acetyltransferase
MEEFQKCVALQREIWGEADLEVEPVTLFVVASETGGQVLGAFDGERMVGFTLAVPGFLEGRVFLHSHMTGVLKGYRDRGVGRALKLFQREEALGRGIRLVVWTFDPLETRNGHFNLNRLGAISRKYLPNLYGLTTSPLHWGLPTDRLWVEWHLDSARVMKAAASDECRVASEGPAMINIPGEIEEWKKRDMKRLAAEQARIREEFAKGFAKGYAAVGVRKTEAGAEYVLAPWINVSVDLGRAGRE